MSRLLSVLLCLPLFFLFAEPGGQERGAESPAPVYDLTLVVYTWPVTGIWHADADIQELPPLYVRDQNGVRHVDIQRGGFSPPLRYQGVEPPVFFRGVAETTPQGEVRHRGVPVIRPEVNPEWREVTLITYPERRNADGTWNYLAVPSSRMEIPEGATRFLNLTQSALVIELGGETRAIPPSGEVTLTSFPASLGDRFRLNIHARDPIRDEVRVIHTTALWREDSSGNLYVIYTQGNRRPRVLHLATRN